MELYPVNNMRTYWEIFGCEQEFPLSFGGNCVFQVEQLKRNIASKIEFVRVVDGVHVAALIDGRFFDPCLLQNTPVSVEREFSLNQLQHGISGDVCVDRSKCNILDVTWRYLMQNGRNVDANFRFDILNPSMSPPDLVEIERFKGVPDLFFLRFFNLESGFLNTLCFDISLREFFWTYHIYPTAGVKMPLNCQLAGQFEESTGLNISVFKEVVFESLAFSEGFWA